MEFEKFVIYASCDRVVPGGGGWSLVSNSLCRFRYRVLMWCRRGGVGCSGVVSGEAASYCAKIGLGGWIFL